MGEKRVQLPDGRIVAFPDSMSDADIAKAIQADLGAKAQPQPSSWQQFQSDVGAPGRTFEQGIQQAKQGNVIGGAANISSGVLQSAFTPITAALAAIRQIPVVGQPISDAINLPGRAVSGAVDWLTGNPQGETPQAINNLTKSVLPVLSMAQIANRIASPPTEPTPTPAVGTAFYQKALRPSGTLEQQAAKVQTGIKEGLLPGSPKSLVKMQNIIQDINGKIDSIVKDSDFIDTDQTVKYVEGMKQKAMNRSVTPEETGAEIQKISDDYLAQHPPQLAATAAQELKKGIYERNKAAYEQQAKTGKLPGNEIHTEMAIARGLKDYVAELYPQINNLNTREGGLLQLEGDFQRSVRTELNKSLLPHSLLVALSPKWWFARLVSDNPQLKAGIAIVVDRAAKAKPPMPPILPQQQPSQ